LLGRAARDGIQRRRGHLAQTARARSPHYQIGQSAAVHEAQVVAGEETDVGEPRRQQAV